MDNALTVAVLRGINMRESSATTSGVFVGIEFGDDTQPSVSNLVAASPSPVFELTTTSAASSRTLLQLCGQPMRVHVFGVGSVGGTRIPDQRRVVGTATVDLSALRYGVPVIDGWYHAIDAHNNVVGQLKVVVKPKYPLNSKPPEPLGLEPFADTTTTTTTYTHIHSAPLITTMMQSTLHPSPAPSPSPPAPSPSPPAPSPSPHTNPSSFTTLQNDTYTAVLRDWGTPTRTRTDTITADLLLRHLDTPPPHPTQPPAAAAASPDLFGRYVDATIQGDGGRTMLVDPAAVVNAEPVAPAPKGTPEFEQMAALRRLQHALRRLNA